jgi:hypothetical protein
MRGIGGKFLPIRLIREYLFYIYILKVFRKQTNFIVIIPFILEKTLNYCKKEISNQNKI